MELHEMCQKGCFHCQKWGHLARNCPEGCKFTKTQVRSLYDDLSAEEDRKELLESLTTAQNGQRRVFEELEG
jgi:hypothetical protein